MPRAITAGTLLLGAVFAVAACDLAELAVPVSPRTDGATAVPASVEPATSPSPSFVRPTPTPLPTFLVYVVRSRDTLSSIATAFGTKAQSVAYWNRATYPSLDPDSGGYDPNTIQVGWTLRLVPNAEVDPEDLPPARTPSPSPVSSPSPSPS